MGHSLKLSTTLLTWKPTMKTFQIIAGNIPNNDRIHVYMNLKHETGWHNMVFINVLACYIRAKSVNICRG